MAVHRWSAQPNNQGINPFTKEPIVIPGRPEQPTWAKFNKGPAQKLAKGRPFRHQGR